MTREEQITAKHQEVYGRSARKDYTEEQVIANIEKKTGEKFIIDEPKANEGFKSQPEVETPIQEVKDEPIPETVTVVKAAPLSGQYKQPGDEVDENGYLIKEGNLHLVYKNGKPVQWTKNVINMALHLAKRNGDKITFPEGSKFDPAAIGNKCEDC
jgi:hypothetical protein